MTIQKIVGFICHGDDSYSVWYEALGSQRICMSNAEYNLAKYIDELLRKGIAPKDIEVLIELTEKLSPGPCFAAEEE